MDGKTVVAVVGCGRIASAAHFPALSRMEDVEIRYACDLIAEKAEDKRTKFGAERAITDYREALADPEVDVVYVLTPNYAHYTVTMDALAAGKHVFCEKPITVSYELALRMSNEAEKRNRLLAIGVCNRYHRSVEELRSLCESGRFGKIYTVYCSFRENRSIPGLGGAFTTAAESGGGVLIDWGIHFLDLILYVIGGAKILTASAETYSEMAKNIEDYKFSSMWDRRSPEELTTSRTMSRDSFAPTSAAFPLTAPGRRTLIRRIRCLSILWATKRELTSVTEADTGYSTAISRHTTRKATSRTCTPARTGISSIPAVNSRTDR